MRQYDETRMGDVEVAAIVSCIVADPALWRDRAPLVRNHSPQPCLRADMDVVQDDTFFKLRAPVDALPSEP